MLEALVNDESAGADIVTGASLMRGFLDKSRNDDPLQLAENLGVDRTRLYRGVSPTYGPPPPYEMVWSTTWQEISLLQTLAGIYREMGMTPAPEAHERLDYIGVELDFMRELALREATAWESDPPAAAAKLLESQQAFMTEHLAGWPAAFVEKALEWVKTDFYKGHLLMLRGFIASEQQELASLVKR
jgi:TorA maturation chaperone TorD